MAEIDVPIYIKMDGDYREIGAATVPAGWVFSCSGPGLSLLRWVVTG